MNRLAPFRLMKTLFLGLVISVAFCIICAVAIYFRISTIEMQNFLLAYTVSFKTLFSFGLIIGTALIVFRSQKIIPLTIESVFTNEQLLNTKYYYYKQRYLSLRRTITFSTLFIIVGFTIFSLSVFPFSETSQNIMIVAACAQYALGVYIGRKLFYASMMLHSLLDAKISRNLFRDRELDEINTYVHLASTLTVIFVYVHVIGYYEGPFLFTSIFKESTRPFLLVPALIATPVLLIFTFYPRAVLRKIYNNSIDYEIIQLRKVLKNEKLTEYEKRSHLMEFDRMSREELRYSLQLALSDLPIGITILIMVLQPLLSN